VPRGSNAPEVVTIYWRDIPAQVNAQLGRERNQVVLPDKFQRSIDRAKRKAGIVTSHEDVAQWRRVSRPCSADLAAEAQAAADTLIAAYTTDRLGRLAYVGGFEPHPDEIVTIDVPLEALEELEELGVEPMIVERPTHSLESVSAEESGTNASAQPPNEESS
jgi:Virulence factor